VKEIERLRQTRLIRTRIARLRRNLDGDAQGVRREGRRLASWRTLAKRFPGPALLSAFGVGLLLSAGLSGRRVTGWFGRRLLSQTARRVQSRLFGEIVDFCDSLFDRNEQPSRPEGGAVSAGGPHETA